MTERRPIAIANWKMYLDREESLRAAEGIRTLVGRRAGRMDIVICPSFPLLVDVHRLLARRKIMVGVQDVHAELQGPFTGDVSVEQIRTMARYVIVGHSERRVHHSETDGDVARKAQRVLSAGMRPIVCVGETAEERSTGRTVERIRTQVSSVLASLHALDLSQLVIAYEPLWAIGAGPDNPAPQPDPQEVTEVIGLIRRVASTSGSRRYLDHLRVIYGGSVTAKTVQAFVSEPGVDGVLVGGASTKPAEFFDIVKGILACRS